MELIINNLQLITETTTEKQANISTNSTSTLISEINAFNENLHAFYGIVGAIILVISIMFLYLFFTAQKQHKLNLKNKQESKKELLVNIATIKETTFYVKKVGEHMENITARFEKIAERLEQVIIETKELQKQIAINNKKISDSIKTSKEKIISLK